tara:strand:+ start:4265 stop:4846 length:582 start_codon:yes stop_codon:yes gene_type:complete
MAEKPNQNWEQRVVDSRGPKFRLDVNNPQMGADGANVYLMYAVTDNKETQFSALSESGTYRLHNERTIEIVSGSKNDPSDVGVKISSVKGDITITVVKNGSVRISGDSVTIQAKQDIDLKAGRNITLNAGMGILLRGVKVQARGLIGNLVGKTAGTWLSRIMRPTRVGEDYLANPPKNDKFLKKGVIDVDGES